jgi:RNA polymerase sigma-70 factor (ECF subfamily)
MSVSEPVLERFRARLGEGARAALDQRADLAESLASHVSAARGAWPALPLTEEQFVEYIAERIPEDGASEFLSGLHAADLWLAATCARGVPGAAAVLDREFISGLDGVLSRAGAEARDELRQRVREKLLVSSDNAPPRIAEYRGRGPLLGWLKVVGSRVALDWLRARDSVGAGEDELLGLPSAEAGPELMHLRDRYRDEFRVALAEASKELGPRARNVLRLHYVDGLTLEQIATVHRVHRLTAVRWVKDAREGLSSRSWRATWTSAYGPCWRRRHPARAMTAPIALSQARLRPGGGVRNRPAM